MKASIIFYSVSGRTYDLAEAIAEGVRSIEDCEAQLYRVQDPFKPEETKFWAPKYEKFAHIPEAKWGDLTPFNDADAIIVGAPVFFGQFCAPLYDWFHHTTAGPWLAGSMRGKVGATFCTCASQNGGAEVAMHSFQITLMHFGLALVPFPNAHDIKELREHDFPMGGTPYGCSGSVGMGPTYRELVDMEKSLGRQHGAYIAMVAKALAANKEYFDFKSGVFASDK